MNSQFIYEVSNRLNLHSTNFLCYIGNELGLKLFPDLAKSVQGLVINEYDPEAKAILKRKKELKDIRFVDNFSELDQGVFDRIIFTYEGISDFRAVLPDLIGICDVGAYVLVSSCFGKELDIEKALEKNGIIHYWFVKDEDKCDLVFKVRK